MALLSLLAAAAISLGPKTEMNVEYSNVGGESLQMDVMQPAEWVARPAPVVVVIHGGAWISGKRTDMTDITTALARNGFVAAAISYRLAPKNKYPTMLDDARTAVRFLRSQATRFGLDPNRMGACGASAGGHMSLLLGLTESPMDTAPYPGYSSKVSAVLDLFGPTDMADFPTTFDPIYESVLGKKRAEGAQEIHDSSPIYFVDRDDAPIFIIHGDTDQVVNPRQSKKFYGLAIKAGLGATLVTIPGMGHEFPLKRKEVREAFGSGISFLKQTLSKP